MNSRIRWLLLGALSGVVVAGSVAAAGVWVSRDQGGYPIDAMEPSAVPSTAAAWAAEGTQNVAHAGQGPAFPAELTGWKAGDEWDGGLRASGDWVSLCSGDQCGDMSYPATMNGCANQRFLLRWRTNDGAPVHFGYGTVAADIGTLVEGQLPQPASIGWAELHGCGWPLWRTTGSNSLSDVTVAVQVWYPAA